MGRRPGRRPSGKPSEHKGARGAPPGKRPAQPEHRAPRPAAAGPVIRPVPLYEFTAGGLVGYLRLTDPDRGIEFSHAVEGKTLPAASKEVLSLRHYLASAVGGLLAPREEASCEGKLDKTSVTFRYDKLRNWPLTASVRYDLLGEGGVDASFEFSFAQKLNRFEAGIETLLPRMQPAVYFRGEGRWKRALVPPHTQRFYARNQAAIGLIGDGRWSGLRMAGITLSMEPQGYDYPALVVRDERTGWALVYMALAEECTCFWVNSAHRTIGFALLGGDAKPNTKATCRLRVVLCRAVELDAVQGQYGRFVQEARRG